MIACTLVLVLGSLSQPCHPSEKLNSDIWSPHIYKYVLFEPSKLIEYGKNNSLKMEKLDGMIFNPVINEWKISRDNSVNYIIQFKKI